MQCPITQFTCPFDPQCSLIEGTGRTYCFEWVKKHQLIGRRLLNMPQVPSGTMIIFEDMIRGQPFYFIYDKQKDKVREFEANKQRAINYCIDHKCKFIIVPMEL